MTDPPDAPVELDPFARLRSMTSARVALGRSGAGLPTTAMLAFQRDHALARDAVQAIFDPSMVAAELAEFETVSVASRAADRSAYLRRPDLGRRLAEADAARLSAGEWDLAIVVADGLSAEAAHRHAPPLVRALTARLTGWRLAPLVLASMARVAVGDEIGACLGAAMVVVLIGERPGLSSPDSLGAYLTWRPTVGRLDSERNCVSNIRPPLGLDYAAAADALIWLATTARQRSATGVSLRDDRTPVDPLATPQPLIA